MTLAQRNELARTIAYGILRTLEDATNEQAFDYDLTVLSDPYLLDLEDRNTGEPSSFTIDLATENPSLLPCVVRVTIQAQP